MSNGSMKTPEQEARENAEQQAASYAWDYFQYHAGQRQAVFRFFVTLVGVLTLAFGYSLRDTNASDHPEYVRLMIGVLLFTMSFLFCRLDQRSQRLIKTSEAALKKAEDRLFSVLRDDTVRLMSIDGNKSNVGMLSYLQSFRQIYLLIFVLVGASGFLIVAIQTISILRANR